MEQVKMLIVAELEHVQRPRPEADGGTLQEEEVAQGEEHKPRLKPKLERPN